MTLPQRKRRFIRTHAGQYRYQFSIDETTNRGRLVIESDDGYRRPTLLVHWLGLLPDKPLIIPRRHLRSTIDFALQSGWHNYGGHLFEMGCIAITESVEFFLRPENSPNDWFIKLTKSLGEPKSLEEGGLKSERVEHDTPLNR